MGIYLNPGNKAFRQIRNGLYVDKTGLADYINGTINTAANLTCFSRPRRFGKSFAAVMLAAYYDKTCDSRELFDGLEISKRPSYEAHLNRYDVIYLDITWFTSRTRNNGKDPVRELQAAVIEELREAFPGAVKEGEEYLPDALVQVSQKTQESFFIIIDEWDALFREAKENEELQKRYLQFLRGLFKSGPAMKGAVAGAYMTGILPVKKYGTESALTDFQEFTMADPLVLSEYIGFTEQEVQTLCEAHGVAFGQMKQWYDGYSFPDISSVYSPNSVMNAIRFRKFKSYWTSSETYEALKDYISMNFDELKDAVVAMLGGQRIRIETLSFQNDMTSFNSRDDVLTLLVHLGYLAYDSVKSQVYIPNLEVAEAFKIAVQNTDWEAVGAALKRSEDLLDATIRQDNEAVAEALESVHSGETSILQYNDENSLSCALAIAYYTARNYYTIIRELPAGKGFADLAFLPLPNVDKPAMIVELKYDYSADTAIRQIHDNRYDGALKGYQGQLLLVGISYVKGVKGADGKHHSCVIERV